MGRKDETMSPGNAGIWLFHALLTAASSKFLPDFFLITGPLDPCFIHYALRGARRIKRIKADARRTGTAHPFLLLLAFAGMSAHIKSMGSSQSYVSMRGALEKPGGAV